MDETPPQAHRPDAQPDRIGGYRIVRELGHGGMGVVYEAIQEQPHRTVALKVVTASRTNAPEVLKRFEREAEVLGRLQHPGIAQIFEAGHFDGGSGIQSFFAMELVRGEPLTEYADAHALEIDARLELVAKVSDAVQHAHERGIIHRDLKPGNILVTESGEPKVLDFGIARVTDADLRTVTLQTDVGQVIGTIPYMSPEQASGNPDQLDTRSDVYALGVVAYELLSGDLPYELDLTHVLEAVRTVREEEARPLSSIDMRLRGDVDTIIGKALEKDRDRRYASAAALADDIRRFLRDEPIAARPPSAFYQLQKFARRNRALVAGVAGVFVALVIGLVGTSLGYVEAEHRREEADAAKERAIASQLRAQQSSTFLASILSSISPTYAQGADTTLLRAILEDTESRIDTELEGLPLVEAEIRRAIGLAHAGLSDPIKALEHLQVSLELFEQELGPNDPSTIRARCQVGSSLAKVGRFEEAEDHLRTAVRQGHEHSGADLGFTSALEKALGVFLQNSGRLTEAAALYEPMLARLENDSDVEFYLNACIPYSTLLLELDRDQEAEALLDELVARTTDILGDSHPVTLQAAFNRLALDKKRGLMSQEVIDRHRDLWLRYLRVHGPHDTNTHAVGRAYAQLLREAGHWDVAEETVRQIVAGAESKLGPDHYHTLAAVRELSVIRLRQGHYLEAEELLTDSLPGLEEQLGPEHDDVVDAYLTLGQIQRRLRNFEEAEASLRRVVASLESIEGQHGKELTARSELAQVIAEQGRYGEAEPLQRRVLQDRKQTYGADHPQTLVAHTALGLTLSSLERIDEAEEQLRLSLEGHRRALGSDHHETGSVLFNLGSLLIENGRAREALPYLVEAAALWHRRGGPDHPSAKVTLPRMYRALEAVPVDEILGADDLDAAEIAHDLSDLAEVLLRNNLNGDALSLAERAVGLTANLEYDDPALAWPQTVLGAALLADGSVGEASALLESAVDFLDPNQNEQVTAAQRWLTELNAASTGR